MKKCIILANGKPPQIQIMKHLQEIGYSTLYCADGGANSAMKLKLKPQYIIGDLDSVHPSTLKYYKKSSTIIKISRQNDTDVEKCLKHVIKKKFDEAMLTGVTGDRLDHTFCNLGIVLKFFNKINVSIVAENSLLTALTGNHVISSYEKETISIYGFDNQTKITSNGLKYPLNKTSLQFGLKESTSNVSTGNKIELKVVGGIIFLIRDFHMLVKHGLL